MTTLYRLIAECDLGDFTGRAEHYWRNAQHCVSSHFPIEGPLVGMRPLLLVFENLARLCIDADFGDVSAALDIE